MGFLRINYIKATRLRSNMDKDDLGNMLVSYHFYNKLT